MKQVIFGAIFAILSTSAYAKDVPCETQFAKAIEKAAKASNVSISSAHELGATSNKDEEHYSALAYYSDSGCEGDSQTFQIYTKNDSCEVVAIHANGDEDCGD